MGADLVGAELGDEAQIQRAGGVDGSRLPVRSAARAHIDLLVTKEQRHAAVTEDLAPHAEHPDIPVGCGVDVAAIEHHVVDAVNTKRHASRSTTPTGPDRCLSPASHRPNTAAQRIDRPGRVPLLDGARSGAEEFTHRVTDLLLLRDRDGELGSPDHGALVWSALADPELAAKVGDRQLGRRRLVPVKPLRRLDLRQALHPPQPIAGLQCPCSAGLLTLTFCRLDQRMPARDALKRPELLPHRIGTAIDVGEHLNLRHADWIPPDSTHNPWQDDGMSPPLLLLDGASMWFRSYFGVPASITAPDGRPVNAVRGFLDAVATLITRERPARLVVCRDDDWRPQWRVDAIPSYKAHRVAVPEPAGQPDIEEVPDDLTPQIDMILEILDAFGIATAGAPQCEADDVLGTLVKRERKDPVVVVSGDRDLLQLVRDEPVPVRVLYLGSGLAKAVKWGPG